MWYLYDKYALFGILHTKMILMLIINFKKIAMPGKKTVPTPVCPLDYAFQRIGGKYKGRIILALMNGVMRYGELRRALSDVTPKMLTQALRELETDQLISRKVYHEVPPKVEYELTANGKDFLPSIRMIFDWGRRQMQLHNLPALPGPAERKKLAAG